MRTFKTVFMRGGTSKGCMFHKEDLPDYQAYQPSECPMCRRKQPLDAIVNSFGYSKL